MQSCALTVCFRYSYNRSWNNRVDRYLLSKHPAQKLFRTNCFLPQWGFALQLSCYNSTLLSQTYCETSVIWICPKNLYYNACRGFPCLLVRFGGMIELIIPEH
jgi:hypothetical protein